MQQPAYTQHQNMDQFQPRMMAIQQDPVHHQVQAFFWQLHLNNWVALYRPLLFSCVIG